MIQDFYNKLSDKEKKVFYGAVIALVLAFFDMLFLRPVLSRLSTIDEQLQETSSAIEKDIRFIAYENKIIKEDEAFRIFETDENKTGEEIIASFLKTVETLSSESGITLVKLNPSEVTSKKGFFLYSASWEGYGSLSNMINFMYRVDTTHNLLKIVKVSMEADRASKENVKASMKIVKLIIDPSTIGNFEFEKDELNMPKTYSEALDVIRSPEAFESDSARKTKAGSSAKAESASSRASGDKSSSTKAGGSTAGAAGVSGGENVKRSVGSAETGGGSMERGGSGKVDGSFQGTQQDSDVGGNADNLGVPGKKDNDLYMGGRGQDRQVNEKDLASSEEDAGKEKKANVLSKSLDKVSEGGRVRVDSLDTLWSNFVNKFFKKDSGQQDQEYESTEYDQEYTDTEGDGNLWEGKFRR